MGGIGFHSSSGQRQARQSERLHHVRAEYILTWQKPRLIYEIGQAEFAAAGKLVIAASNNEDLFGVKAFRLETFNCEWRRQAAEKKVHVTIT